MENITLSVQTIDDSPAYGTGRWLVEHLREHGVVLAVERSEVALLYPNHCTSAGKPNPLRHRIAWLEGGEVRVPTDAVGKKPETLIWLPLDGIALAALQPAARAAYEQLEQQAAEILRRKVADDDRTELRFALTPQEGDQ